MHKISKCKLLNKLQLNDGVTYTLLIFSYFKDGLKTIAHFGTYIEDLSSKLQNIKQKQDEERRRLLELKTLLRSTPDFDRVEVCLQGKHPFLYQM